jgi:hypothetical protein
LPAAIPNSLWTLNDLLLTDESGRPIICNICPCDTIDECGGIVSSSGDQSYPEIVNIDVSTDIGYVVLKCDAEYVPDRFVVIYDGQVVIDTSYLGSLLHLSDLKLALAGTLDPISGNIYPFSDPLHLANGYPYITRNGAFSFNKTTQFPTTIQIQVFAPLSGTVWHVDTLCPDATITPETAPPSTPIDIMPLPTPDTSIIIGGGDGSGNDGDYGDGVDGGPDGTEYQNRALNLDVGIEPDIEILDRPFTPIVTPKFNFTLTNSIVSSRADADWPLYFTSDASEPDISSPSISLIGNTGLPADPILLTEYRIKSYNPHLATPYSDTGLAYMGPVPKYGIDLTHSLSITHQTINILTPITLPESMNLNTDLDISFEAINILTPVILPVELVNLNTDLDISFEAINILTPITLPESMNLNTDLDISFEAINILTPITLPESMNLNTDLDISFETINILSQVPEYSLNLNTDLDISYETINILSQVPEYSLNLNTDLDISFETINILSQVPEYSLNLNTDLDISFEQLTIITETVPYTIQIENGISEITLTQV